MPCQVNLVNEAETQIFRKRALRERQKRPVHYAKNPHEKGKRALFITQKSPIHYEKDLHSLRKRALRNIVCARMRRVPNITHCESDARTRASFARIPIHSVSIFCAKELCGIVVAQKYYSAKCFAQKYYSAILFRKEWTHCETIPQSSFAQRMDTL